MIIMCNGCYKYFEFTSADSLNYRANGTLPSGWVTERDPSVPLGSISIIGNYCESCNNIKDILE